MLNNLSLNKLNILILLSIVIKLFFFIIFINYQKDLYSYEYDYQKLIDNFYVKGKNFNESIWDERLPVYQIFIFLIYSVFKNEIIISLIQILLSLINLILIYKIGLIFNKRFALILVLVSVLNPSYVLFSYLLLADYLFLLFSLSFIYFFLKFIVHKKLSDSAVSYFFLGLMALTKPVIIYFPIFLLIFLIIFPNKNKLKSIFLLFLIFYSMSSSWALRNFYMYGDYFYMGQNQTNIVNWYLPLFEQEQNELNFKQAQDEINKQWEIFKNQNNNNTNLSKKKFDDELSKKFFLSKILEYEFSTIFKCVLYGSMKTLLLPSFSEFKYYLNFKPELSFYRTEGRNFLIRIKNYFFSNNNTIYSFLVILFFSITLFLRLVQFKYFLRLFYENKSIFIFFLIYISYFLIVSGPIGSARYRLPFEIIFIFTTSKWIENFLSRTK